MSWLTDEILFYSGAVFAGISLVALAIYFCISRIHAVRLDAQLDTEYGPEEKNHDK